MRSEVTLLNRRLDDDGPWLAQRLRTAIGARASVGGDGLPSATGAWRRYVGSSSGEIGTFWRSRIAVGKVVFLSVIVMSLLLRSLFGLLVDSRPHDSTSTRHADGRCLFRLRVAGRG